MADEDNAKQGEDELHALTAPLFLAIGHVAHHFSRLEHQVNQLIWEIAGIDSNDGACITSQIPSIMPRFRALIALAHKHGCSSRLLKDLNRFATDADAIARQRNRIIHDPWYFRVNAEIEAIEYGRLEISADRKLTFEVKPKTSKEVLDVAHKIIDATTQFKELQERVRAELKALRESPPGTSSEGSPDHQSPDTDS
jgi:hypothetical protein